MIRRLVSLGTFNFPRWAKIVLALGGVLILVVAVNRFAASIIDQRLKTEMDLIGLAFQAESVSAQLFSVSPRITLNNLSLGWPDGETFLYQATFDARWSWLALLRGTVHITRFDVHTATMSLDRAQKDDARLMAWVQRMSPQDGSELAVSLSTLNFDDVTLEIFNDQTDQHANVRVNGSLVPEVSGSRLSLQLDGDWNLVPIRTLVSVTASKPLVSNVETENNRLQFQLNSRFSQLDSLIDGEMLLGEWPLVTRLAVEVEGHGVSDAVEKTVRVDTSFDAIRLVGDWRGELNGGGAGSLELQVDRSDLSVKIFAMPKERTNDAKRWVIDSQSKRLEFGSVEALRNLVASIESSSSEGFKPEKAESNALWDHFFYEHHVDLNAVFGSVVTESVEINDIYLKAQQSSDDIQLNAYVVNIGNGKLTAEMNASRRGEAWVGNAAIEVDKVEIRDVFVHGEAFDLMAGVVSGQSRLAFVGQSLPEIVSNLNGDNTYVVESGELDSLLVEMAGMDFMESVGLVANRQAHAVNIDCGFIDAPISRGRIQVKRFLFDTPDTVFTMRGYIDLPEERLDLSFTPSPRDASYFTARTSVRIVGPIVRPKIRPGKELYTRVALAAALATFAAPAAVLLPFMDIGDAESVSNCLNDSVN